MQHRKWWLFLAVLSPVVAFASPAGEEADPITFVLLGVTTIFFFAILGRYIARRLNQPSVLGELLMGVLIGNLFYFYGFQLIILLREGAATFDIVRELLNGVPLNTAVTQIISNPEHAQQVIAALGSPRGADYLKIAYVVDIFSRYGVIFLLFMVGLESSIEELKHTGRDSLLVAIIGVVVPMLLGFGVAFLLMPEASFQADLFIAATLSATSIGITARVLAEMKKLRTREARTILGAAMLDDVLGLIILAVVSSVVINGAVDFMVVLRIVMASILFFISALLLGPFILRRSIHFSVFLNLGKLSYLSHFYLSCCFRGLLRLSSWQRLLGHLQRVLFCMTIILNRLKSIRKRRFIALFIIYYPP